MTPRKPDSAALERLLSARSLQEPPRDVLHRAIALGALLPSPAPSLGEWLVRLVFDSGAQPVPAGLRSGGSAERRLLFEATSAGEPGAVRQVDLRLRRESGGDVEVIGQCLPPLPGTTVEVRSGRSTRRATLDESGEFLLRRVPGRAEALSLAWTSSDGDEVLLAVDAVPVPEDPARRG